jgi:hypothetical protein
LPRSIRFSAIRISAAACPDFAEGFDASFGSGAAFVFENRLAVSGARGRGAGDGGDAVTVGAGAGMGSTPQPTIISNTSAANHLIIEIASPSSASPQKTPSKTFYLRGTPQDRA